jgi:DNA polymerase-3 subunit chi
MSLLQCVSPIAGNPLGDNTTVAEPIMPRIDFYILNVEGAQARAHFCCRLAARAWREGMSVYIRSADEAAAAHLDTLLWTFDATSFIPHGQDSQNGNNPIVISPSHQPGALLINLADSPSDDWQDRERVAEVITADTATRKIGRLHYRHYQQAGSEPHTHHIEH